MPELKERFSLADELDAPELWAEAARRAAAPSAPPRAAREWPPGAARRAAVGALAFAVFAVAVSFAWDLANPDRRPTPRPPAAVDLAAELPEGWTELPQPPEVRDQAATAWTGSQLITWGGHVFDGSNEDPQADGFAFEARERRWDTIPASPLEGRSAPAFAWTGTELLIWGGWDGGFRDPPHFDDGAAYDPTARTWRRLPDSPLSARSPFSVWTGTEFIVWGSHERSDRRRDGAAYDTATDSWRPIADAPIAITDGSAVWTGEEMIVFGATLDGNNRATTPTSIGIAYDPENDSWRELPPSDLSPQATTASWLDGEMIAWDYDQASAAYDPGADTWRPLPDVPIPFSECYPESVSNANDVLGEFCGRIVLFSSAVDRWREVTPPTMPAWVVEPVTAGNAFLVLAHPSDARDSAMFAYDPPVPDPNATPFVPATTRTGDHVAMPATFPDGTRIEVRYPRDLDLASLGVEPSVSYLWRADPPPRFPIVFLFGADAAMEHLVEGSVPVGAVVTQPGVEIWQMSSDYAETRRLSEGHWLRFRLPSWTVLVALGERDDADEVASHLTIRETGNGFPVADATGPIALSEESGEGEGPLLTIGSSLDPSIFLWLERCSGPDRAEGQYGSACLADGRVTAQVIGRRGTVAAIVEGMQVVSVTAPA